MTTHLTRRREEWLAAPLELLEDQFLAPHETNASVAALRCLARSSRGGSQLTHVGDPARLFGINEQCARIAAARQVAERRRIPLVINARTDTFLLGLGSGVEERVRLTAERGLQYLRAGNAWIIETNW